MSTIIEERDGLQKSFYTYDEARKQFGCADPEELSAHLHGVSERATAGNVSQWAEDNGQGIVITTSW